MGGWSCCKKRVTDFGEFLAMPGCTAGPHSNEKPQETVKPEVISKPKEEKAEFLKERDAKNYGEQKIISAPPKHDQLKKKEAETQQKEVIHVMTPKIKSVKENLPLDGNVVDQVALRNIKDPNQMLKFVFIIQVHLFSTKA